MGSPHGSRHGSRPHGGVVSQGGMARVKDGKLALVDLATLIYVAVSTVAVLVFTGGDRVGSIALLSAHILAVCLVLLAPQARADGPTGRFAGDWYPLLLLGAFYAEVGVLNVDVGYHHDLAIQRLEQWVFGSQVSYRWIRATPGARRSRRRTSPARSWRRCAPCASGGRWD